LDQGRRARRGGPRGLGDAVGAGRLSRAARTAGGVGRRQRPERRQRSWRRRAEAAEEVAGVPQDHSPRATRCASVEWIPPAPILSQPWEPAMHRQALRFATLLLALAPLLCHQVASAASQRSDTTVTVSPLAAARALA